jgi:Ni/Co efflux regulator RcnB
MRKLIIVALMAATALPTAAMAQSRQELRHDRREVREERRDLREAQRYGDRGDVREARGDLRDARQEGREDWRDYRRSHRDAYRAGNWNAPFRYRTWNEGSRIRPVYYSSRYYIADPYRYRLPAVRGPLRYVRHYNDVLLVNTRSGTVVRVYRNLFW